VDLTIWTICRGEERNFANCRAELAKLSAENCCLHKKHDLKYNGILYIFIKNILFYHWHEISQGGGLQCTCGYSTGARDFAQPLGSPRGPA